VLLVDLLSGTAGHDEPVGTSWRINLRIASGSCFPAAPAKTYDRSNPLGPSIRISQFSLGARSADRHAPLSWFVTQCVLKTSNNFPTQLSITEILQLNRQSHRTAILLKCLLPLCWCKPVKAAPDRAVKLAVEPLIHNTCLKIWERDKCDVRAGHTHGVPDES